MTDAKLEIFTDNGSCLTFPVEDASKIDALIQYLKSPRLFTQKTLILASKFSVANIQTQTIEMIRFHLPPEGTVEPDENSEDVIEISKEAFETEYHPLPEEEKLAARYAAPGNLMTTYVEIHTEGGREVYLQLHVKKRSSQEGRVFFTHLFDRPTMEFRLENGGFGIIKPAKVTSQITYPGPGTDVLPGNTLTVD